MFDKHVINEKVFDDADPVSQAVKPFEIAVGVGSRAFADGPLPTQLNTVDYIGALKHRHTTIIVLIRRMERMAIDTFESLLITRRELMDNKAMSINASMN